MKQKKKKLCMRKLRNIVLIFILVVSMAEIGSAILFRNKIGTDSLIVYLCLLFQGVFLAKYMYTSEMRVYQYFLIPGLSVALIFIGFVLLSKI